MLIDRASSSLDNRLEELGSFLDSSISLRNSFHESDHFKDELKPSSWLVMCYLHSYYLCVSIESLKLSCVDYKMYFV